MGNSKNGWPFAWWSQHACLAARTQLTASAAHSCMRTRVMNLLRGDLTHSNWFHCPMPLGLDVSMHTLARELMDSRTADPSGVVVLRTCARSRWLWFVHIVTPARAGARSTRHASQRADRHCHRAQRSALQSIDQPAGYAAEHVRVCAIQRLCVTVAVQCQRAMLFVRRVGLSPSVALRVPDIRLTARATSPRSAAATSSSSARRAYG
jgi:hypothetical protein